jgi:hypothetical protein
MFASREADAFLSSLAEPEAVQQQLLLSAMVAPNADCEFGRRHAFAKIRTVADYQAAVPIANYDDFAGAIDRMVHRSEQGLLTAEPVKRFFLTSGSTQRSKYIPVTRSFIRAKSRTFGIYWSLVFRDHPEVRSAPMVTNFSDSGDPVHSPGGLPCSSESAYWASVTRATQRRERPIIPKAVAQIGDSDARYYAIARILLEESFSVIMTLNPSTIVLLLQKVRQHAAQLAADVRRGGVDGAVPVGDTVRAYLQAEYPANPARAAEVEALIAQDDTWAHRLWPDLSLAICWRSPMLQPYIGLLQPHFADRVASRDYILMASEGVMAVPIGDGGSGGVVALGSHFYEFIREEDYDKSDRATLLPHELEVGRSYVVVLTNGAGLYRYDIGDVVRVVRFEARTPVIEFLHRAGSTCSLTGEKLTEDQVTAAVGRAAADLGVSIEGFTLAPAKEGFPRYVALVEFADAPPRAALRAFAGRLDETLEAQNMEYGSKRSSQRLAAPELWVVKPGGYQTRRRQRLASGTSDSQIKPTHLTRDSSFGEQFEITERFDAD